MAIDYKNSFNKIVSVNVSVPDIANNQTGSRIDGASSLHYLHEIEFINTLEKIFNKPIYFENDANCASLAELHFGAGKNHQDMLFLVIGTGIGGTVIYNRKIKRGAHDFAGEFGMMLVDGRHEWAVLGSAVHMARKVSKEIGWEVTGEEVFTLAKEGNTIAKKAVEELYFYNALGIYNLQYILDPEVIIIGGGISKHPDLIKEINLKLKEIMSFGQRSPLIHELHVCEYGNDANLIGASMIDENYGGIVKFD
ncbi:ROK family protein [Vagococcus fluvialis]|uniref:ROK family protein n=1 Tax=Vagococcus fluvialis TaxID=2738 RepID=UPI001D0A20D0|nr:ROK family protein [Vagococcus fluvialis]MDT2782416.1 ROK family protein [Vagococcus fluvialis]UDM71692.1 ROK family protein [Vagococcus fluvialis]UDM74888.1 ROK family protein [Vagococcus fluvialis]UDM76555.1 ROK family protein [Vagococcus fluvialis]UDM80467.1 ROK family protein [Vagococcus fluvialis]